MPNSHLLNNNIYREILLQVQPLSHGVGTSFIGSINSPQAGAVIFGYYNIDYRLPGGDYLRIIANHNKSIPQILLFTHDPEKLKNLPGKRPASLTADCIRHVNDYLIRSDCYPKPRQQHQEKKYFLAKQCLYALSTLLEEERQLLSHDWAGQEKLRTKIISLIEQCRDQNRLLANNPLVSEGYLGNILYKAKQSAQYYQFNRVFPVSRLDQLDFTAISNNAHVNQSPCFVWDSEIHIKQDEEDLNNTLRVICTLYDFELPLSLINLPTNRFARLSAFFHKIYQESKHLTNHLAKKTQPVHEKQTWTRSDGLTLTTIKPNYRFVGINQKGYPTLGELIKQVTKLDKPGDITQSIKDAYDILTTQSNGSWVNIPEKKQAIIRINNSYTILHYFKEKDLFYPKPSGEDLFKLSQLTKSHLFLPDKINLQLKAFLSRVPQFFKYIFQNLYLFLRRDLYQDFTKYIHDEHITTQPERPVLEKPIFLKSITEIMIGHGLLQNGQSLEEFIQHHITTHHYIIVKEEHIPNLTFYTNPFHKILNVARHFGMFFINKSEENPLIGTLAMLAYLYGGGAIIAPEALKALLVKLHLKGLIAGIEPTQKLGRWMNHGTLSEAISAAVIYWQSIITAGDLDQFFIQAIHTLRDNPAEIAIILALAMGLGYGLCKAIPVLQKEMGPHPELNYLALGAKGGAAIYDTVMHPGDDWLLGSIKWFFKGLATIGKILFSPFIEAHYYGYQGFLIGSKKSGRLAVLFLKQAGVAILDLLLSIATIPLLEIGSLLIHVPFRGITNLLSRTLGLLGSIESIAQTFIAFAKRKTSSNYLTGFRITPLYGYTNPLATYSNNKYLNLLLNSFWIISLPIIQTIKNFICLPLIDSLTLLIRLALTVFNPLSRGLFYCVGLSLLAIGSVWDDTIGPLCRLGANTITSSSNWLERQFGYLKQFLLAKIQVCRQYLYHQAFHKEDEKNFQLFKNSDYFLEKPIRLDQLEHAASGNSYRFLNLLLNTISAESSLPKSSNLEGTQQAALFTKQKESQKQTFTLNDNRLSI
ncbi:hypothetical protein ACNVED_09800 [Legionella sp. D16C41]|uniref:hypothetical protein n=1 Tax=Legionella sp. D16C41 TaxID=3402688 RepID=UPI003AF7A126